MGMDKNSCRPTAQHRQMRSLHTSLKKTTIKNFEELCDPDENINPCSSYNELAEYVNMKVAKNTDMMQFCDHRTQFPKLYAV